MKHIAYTFALLLTVISLNAKAATATTKSDQLTQKSQLPIQEYRKLTEDVESKTHTRAKAVDRIDKGFLSK